MTSDQWEIVPDSVLRDGLRLLEWCAERGVRRPSLAELEAERARRGVHAVRWKPANREET